MFNTFIAFIVNERGATAVEYGLIATLVCVALLGGASSAGVSLSSLWNNNAEIANQALVSSGE
ncbi:MAG: Flp family type IVb pilin [Rhizobiaceae bacterium]|nr:Flp family type IVb pilin [Rhizobiaceae bacterium]